MKDIKQFIIEGKAPEKISTAGKKKVTNFVNDCIKHVDDIFDYAGIPTDDCEQVYADCRDTVWNWADDNNICSMWSKDDDTCSFIQSEYDRLASFICDTFNL